MPIPLAVRGCAIWLRTSRTVVAIDAIQRVYDRKSCESSISHCPEAAGACRWKPERAHPVGHNKYHVDGNADIVFR